NRAAVPFRDMGSLAMLPKLAVTRIAWRGKGTGHSLTDIVGKSLPKSMQLRVAALALGLALAYFLSEQGFPPQRHQPLWGPAATDGSTKDAIGGLRFSVLLIPCWCVCHARSSAAFDKAYNKPVSRH